MKRSILWTMMIFVILLATGVTATLAQKAEPPTAMVSIYRVAPGKHLDFLKWQAARDVAAREAGLPAVQWYAHTDGDSWDFVSVGPDTTKEQDAKVDELLKKKGLKTGFAGGLEFRTFISSHTDTKVVGPVTAAQLVAMAEK